MKRLTIRILLLAGLVGGAHGAVGTTYSFAAPLYRRILNAFRRGEIDKAEYEERRRVLDA